MARPSSQELRERIDLERVRNAELVRATGTPMILRGSTSDVTLAVLDAIAKWWTDESIRLEPSSKRADATNRKEYRVAARQTEAIATSIRQHGCGDDGTEPASAPLDTARAIAETLGSATVPLCGTTYVNTLRETQVCVLVGDHPEREHRDARGRAWLDAEPTPVDPVLDDETRNALAGPAPSPDVSAEIAAYISGDADMPSSLLAAAAPELAEMATADAARVATLTALAETERTPEPVQFADPTPIEPARQLSAAERVLASNAPDDVQSVAYDLAAPGEPYPGGTYAWNGAPVAEMPAAMFADPAPAGARFRGAALTFADLAAAPAGAPPEHRSISQLTTYSDCGLKYRLQKRDGVPGQPQWANIGGKALHGAIEEMERTHAHAAPTGVVSWTAIVETFDLDQLWATHFNRQISETITANPDWPMDGWRASAKGQEGMTWWMHEGADMLRRYVAWRTEWDKEWTIARTPAGVPIIEYEFVLNVDGIPVKGIIDQAWSHRATGRLCVVDAKSGAKKPDESLQLRTYGYALLYVAGVPVLDTPDSWSGAYFDARKGTLSDPVPVITADGWAELRYRFHAMDAADRAGVHLPRPSSFCGGCSVKHVCPLRAY